MRKKLMSLCKYKSNEMANKLYLIMIILFVMLFTGMILFQNNEIYHSKQEYDCKVIEYDNKQIIHDANAPLGFIERYNFKIKNVESNFRYLMFYAVHQYVEVHFDDELVYSLKPKSSNKIGKTPASNWVMIPAYCSNKEIDVSINITNVYDNIKAKDPVFMLGNKVSIYIDQFKHDLPQMLLSLLSIIIGIIYIIISISHKNKGKEVDSVRYLGIFAFSIGMWKLNDIKFSPLMFPKNTLALFYIAISMVIISAVSLLLSIKKKFFEKYYYVLEIICVIYSFTALLVFFLQIMNIVDLRETLVVIHIVIGISSVALIILVILESINNRTNKRLKILRLCLMICVLGALVDMYIFYTEGTSSMILFALISALIYIITIGCTTIIDLYKKANIDSHTGLFNKGRCKEILDKNDLVECNIGIMMFDLNRLKYTNDTFGHKSGDKIIADFAHILRKTIDKRCFIGRYGGDEFIAIIKDADEYIVKEICLKIDDEVQKYNLNNKDIYISFSVGYALSSKYPNLSLHRLLEIADYNMYADKKKARKTTIW